MKKIFLAIVFCGLGFLSFSQNINFSQLRGSDIPSKEVLQQMGLSSFEITEALNYKNNLGIYKRDLDSVITVEPESDFIKKIDSRINKFWKLY